MKIYLDDLRPTPEGYARTYTVEETIEAIKKFDGKIQVLSLDNDLGYGLKEGYQVMRWLEEQAYHGTIQPIPKIIFHSQNSSAVHEMKMARTNCYKYWERILQ